MANDPPTPTPPTRTKCPFASSYSKYLLRRSCSKSSHQTHSARGVAHSLGGGGLEAAPLPPVPTVMATVPLLPSLVAVMVAAPTATPVTSPLVSTRATDVSLLDHRITRLESVLPFPSSGIALSCNDWPAAIVAQAGLAATAATGPEQPRAAERSEEHTSELQSPCNLVCRLLLEK